MLTPSLSLACAWFILANLAAMLPSRDNHWQRAVALIVVGVPLLGWVTYQNGPWIGMLVLAGGMSVLRWPLVHMVRWLRNRRSRLQ